MRSKGTGDWPARAEHHHPVRLASSPAGQRSGCRSRTRGFWTAAASEFLCLRPLGRRCGSFGIAVEGCRTGPDAARAGLLLTHPAVVHSARRAPSTPPPFWPEEALFQSMVWALGRSERSAFDVGHGQGMLDAEEAGLLPSPRERERSILLFLADAATQRRRHSGKDLAASTVKGLAAHVWRELKLRGLVDPTRPRSFMYSTAWRGMQARLGRPVAQRRAFLPGDLRAWLTTPSFLSRAPPRRLRDATVLATGIAGFLRGAELVALRVDDLEFSLLPSPRIALHIRRSKTDRTAHGAVVYLTPGKCPASCPVRLLCAYVASTAVQAAPGTPLFPRLSDPAAAITVGFVRRLVKEAAEAIGYDPTDFSGHSLRRGGATAAARRGLPATWIRRHGRWALYSSVPQGYIEDYLFHLSSDLADLGF
eukprot:tig00021326_g20268.t1